MNVNINITFYVFTFYVLRFYVTLKLDHLSQGSFHGRKKAAHARETRCVGEQKGNKRASQMLTPLLGSLWISLCLGPHTLSRNLGMGCVIWHNGDGAAVLGSFCPLRSGYWCDVETFRWRPKALETAISPKRTGINIRHPQRA